MGKQDFTKLDDMLAQLCDGDLSAKQREALTKELRESKSARQSYIRYLSLHYWLRNRCKRWHPDEDALSLQASDIESELSSAQPGLRKPLWLWAAGLAATLLIAAVAWNLGSGKFGGSVNNRSVAAIVLASHQSQWAEKSDARRIGKILRDRDLLDLRSGVVELQFDSGARLIVVGPTRLEITSARSCNLQAGELVANMSEGVDGFSVTVGSLKVVDLGTEFGARRVKGDEIQLEVFDGKVAVYDTSVPPMSSAVEPVGTMQAGQTATASLSDGKVTDSLRIGATLSGEFTRKMPAAASRFDGKSSIYAADGFGGISDGQRLAGINSGVGWKSAWRADEFAKADVVCIAAQATNYTQGNAAVYRFLPQSLDKSQPIYASATFRINGPDPICTAWVLLYSHTINRDRGETNLMAFGISDGKFSGRLASSDAMLTLLPEAKSSGDFGSYVKGDEHRIVVKLEFDAVRDKERLTVWIDPDEDDELLPPSPDNVVTRDTGQSHADSLAVRFWEMDSSTRGYVDDIRIGPTWRSVVD